MDTSEFTAYSPGLALWEKDIKSIYTGGNLTFTHWCGFREPDQVLDILDYDIPSRMAELADICRENDQKIISVGKPLQFFEVLICADNSTKLCLVTKSPRFDRHDEIIGVSAQALDVTLLLNGLGNLLFSKREKHIPITQLGSYTVGAFPYLSLTLRQEECLFFTLKGKTSKEIAKLLKCSHRTIEAHIEAIKVKLNCKTKKQLMEAAINYGLIYIIPRHLFNNQLSLLL